MQYENKSCENVPDQTLLCLSSHPGLDQIFEMLARLCPCLSTEKNKIIENIICKSKQVTIQKLQHLLSFFKCMKQLNEDNCAFFVSNALMLQSGSLQGEILFVRCHFSSKQFTALLPYLQTRSGPLFVLLFSRHFDINFCFNNRMHSEILSKIWFQFSESTQ